MCIKNCIPTHGHTDTHTDIQTHNTHNPARTLLAAAATSGTTFFLSRSIFFMRWDFRTADSVRKGLRLARAAMVASKLVVTWARYVPEPQEVHKRVRARVSCNLRHNTSAQEREPTLISVYAGHHGRKVVWSVTVGEC